jgi:hypothetical protein
VNPTRYPGVRVLLAATCGGLAAVVVFVASLTLRACHAFAVAEVPTALSRLREACDLLRFDMENHR